MCLLGTWLKHCEENCLKVDKLCNCITSCCDALQKVDPSSTSCNAVHNPCYNVQFCNNILYSSIVRQVDEKDLHRVAAPLPPSEYNTRKNATKCYQIHFNFVNSIYFNLCYSTYLFAYYNFTY